MVVTTRGLKEEGIPVFSVFSSVLGPQQHFKLAFQARISSTQEPYADGCIPEMADDQCEV